MVRDNKVDTRRGITKDRRCIVTRGNMTVSMVTFNSRILVVSGLVLVRIGSNYTLRELLHI